MTINFGGAMTRKMFYDGNYLFILEFFYIRKSIFDNR